ncbi:MAG TPA: TIM-barrel domain-containing protein [Thermoanaerobaculia bacterium]|nr:TIM-barrel domain-containing protein [Thermoanaerobaculia bacterium]
MNALSGLLLLLALNADPADAKTISAGSITLRANPAEGTFVLEGPATTGIPGLWMDGVHQRGFRAVDGSPALRNDAVEVRAESIAADAIAVTWTPRDGRVHELRLRIRSDDETEYYGTGERFQALNQRGFILPMRVDDRYGNKGVGSHKPVPFFISSKGFGVWVDSFATGVFDLSGSERFNTDLTFSDTRLRVVFIGGPSIANILKTYTALTGRSPVPPAWSFGLWKSRDVHHNREEVLEDVEKLRTLGIPASVLVIDSPWETGYNDFVVNREQFSEAEAMFARVEQLGFHLALWLTPFVNNRNVVDMKGIAAASRNFEEAAAGGHLVRNAGGEVALSEWWKGTGGLVDFTRPAAKEWWFAQLRKTKWTGVRAFKCDDGEGNFVPDALFHDGTPAALMKNRYSVLYNEAMQEYIDRELGGDGVLIVRSGYSGVQKTPFAWAGDNRADLSFSDGLPSVILAAQNAALSGISLWGSDIAGYAGTPDRETFIRWTQFATFCPFMQVHMTSNLGPWDFGEEAQEIFRRFAVLRMQLFPYLYDAVHETARSGMPVIRPMVLAFPDDRMAHQQIYQFLFGPDLLVAPMYRPGGSRSVYLPKGTWLDYWSGTSHEGPKTIDVAASLDRIPLFVRAGAIIPMLPEDVQTLVPRHARMDAGVVAIDDRRAVKVWPGAPRSLATWDGMSIESDGEGVRITSNRARSVEIHFAGEGEPKVVEVNLRAGRPQTISRPRRSPAFQ